MGGDSCMVWGDAKRVGGFVIVRWADRSGLMIRLDTSKLGCDSQEFATALLEEGIDGVFAGYPFFPTDQPWHRDAVVFGKSGLPWSALGRATRAAAFRTAQCSSG